MHESSFWRSIKTGLQKASNNKIYLQRIEDKLSSGLPDVHFCYKGKTGWIELKQLPEYPIKIDTSIKIPHLTIHQKQWHKNYYEAQGKSFALIKIKRDSYLFKGSFIDCLEATKMTWKYVLCLKCWENKIDHNELLFLITS